MRTEARGQTEARTGKERRLSGREATSGCVLSERHPVAAGLMNTSVFVIIPHRQKGESWNLILTTRTTCRCWGGWRRGCAGEKQGEPAQLAQQAETHIQVHKQSRLSPVVNFSFSGRSRQKVPACTHALKNHCSFISFQRRFDQVCRRWENHQCNKVGRKTQSILIEVFISVAGLYSYPGLSVYCATKQAIEGFSEVWNNF